MPVIVHLKLLGASILGWGVRGGGVLRQGVHENKMTPRCNGLSTQSVSMYMEIVQGNASTRINTIQDTMLTPRYKIWYGWILATKRNSQQKYISIECLLNTQIHCLPFGPLLHAPGMNLTFNWSNNSFPYCYISQTISPHYFIKYR